MLDSNENVSYVAVDKVYTDHSQGIFHKTDNPLDLALEGEGFFQVETPQGRRYTRNGNFRLDTQEFLVTQDGNYILDNTQEKIKIEDQGGQIDVGTDGTITVGKGFGNEQKGKIGLVKFEDPTVLAKEGNGLYKVMDNQAKPIEADNIKVSQGVLERSNVNSIEEMTKMITTAGFKPKQVPFIPYSGFQGENLVTPTNKMPWYKGWSANISKTETVNGVTLYDALEKLVRPPVRYPNKPLRIPINGIYKIKGVGDVVTGRIEQGTLNAGDIVRVAREGIENLKVFSIEMHHKTWPNAKPGDNVGMNMKGLDKKNMPKVGDVISLQTDITLLSI